MKARVSARLLVSSQVGGEPVRDYLSSYLAGKALFATDRAPTLEQDEQGAWIASCDVRFELPADADAFYADVQGKWALGPLAAAILAGSRVSLHLCPHEEPEAAWYGCRELQAAFVEAVK